MAGEEEEDFFKLIIDYLDGSARKWVEPLLNLPTRWPTFKKRFLEKFNGAGVLAKITTSLFT